MKITGSQKTGFFFWLILPPIITYWRMSKLIPEGFKFKDVFDFYRAEFFRQTLIMYAILGIAYVVLFVLWKEKPKKQTEKIEEADDNQGIFDELKKDQSDYKLQTEKSDQEDEKI